jgi:uncharacterized ion transporter superfamily protein YfcC
MRITSKTTKKSMPHVFVILFFLILITCVLTYIIPSGEFERILDKETGQTIVIAGSYTQTEGHAVDLWKIPQKFFQALIDKKTAQLIFFILFIGGSFEIIMKTGSLFTFFNKVLVLFQNKKIWIIPVFVSLFSVLGFTMGLSTASILFVPIGILAARMSGFGLLTGTAMVALGVNAGFAAGVFNPFSVGIAQSIAELPLYSGAWIRWLLLFFLVSSTSLYIMHYAKKYDKNEELEEIQSEKVSRDYDPNAILSLRQKLVLSFFISTFGVLTFGIINWNWKVENIATLFLVSSIFCGFIYGFKANEICTIFVDGGRKMMTGVFVIGLAATMRLILSDGQILDTIAQFLTGSLSNVPNWMMLMSIFYGNALLDFLITSGSAHAAVVMPVITPLADSLEISRQSAVFAFQLGDGLVNLCSPLSTTLTGLLAVSNISYGRWVKFFFPLVGIYMIIGTAFIFLANIVGY